MVRSGFHAVVFALHSVDSYTYECTSIPAQTISLEFFENEIWYIRLILEGEDPVSYTHLNDHYHAGDPDDFKKAMDNFVWIDTVLGSDEKVVLDCEIIPRREARRSLVLTRDMKVGEVIKAEDLMPKRPGTGISPQFTEMCIRDRS